MVNRTAAYDNGPHRGEPCIAPQFSASNANASAIGKAMTAAIVMRRKTEAGTGFDG